MRELTTVEIERQDFVDNAIYELLQRLNPSPRKIEWNIETIASIRETIRYWLVEYHEITDEMRFYPFIEERNGM